MRVLPLAIVLACGPDTDGKGGDGDTATGDADADTDADTDSDADADSDTDTDTPPSTGDTGSSSTGAWTDWSCVGAACDWDCTGTGLRLLVPGIYDVNLTVDCTLELEAWGGGGGGGGNDAGSDRGGGGGGGGTLVRGDDGTDWVVAGGGGGGGAGDGGADPPGGAGGGGHAIDVVTFVAGSHLTLVVGGGGLPGCNNVSGDGGGPAGGAGSTCSGDDAYYGGAGGRVAGCGSPGDSTYGGGGGGNGSSVWGGAGGGDSGSGCDGLSTYGGNAGGGAGSPGGGGGGGGALGTTSDRGQTGAPGSGTSAGGAATAGGAGGVVGALDGLAPGGGGAGAGPCGGLGADGALYLGIDPGPGAVCPADEIADCAGGCELSRWYGDGVCDAAFDCVALLSDDGDCPAVGVQLPDFLTTACPAVTAEATFCFTAQGYDLGLVGLTSGNYCPLVANAGYSYDFDNLAFPAPYRTADVCDYGVVAEYDLELGGVRSSATSCSAVTEHLGGILVQTFAGYDWYATFDDVLAGAAVPVVIAIGTDLKVASDGATLYGSWFTDDRVSRGDFATGNMLSDVVLQGFDDSVDGLDAHGGVLRVLSGSDVLEFDPVTGVSQGVRPLGLSTHGLGCVSP